MQPPKNGNSGHLKPSGKPIYAANEKELQKKIKNRQSALESRRKNKEKFERLGKFALETKTPIVGDFKKICNGQNRSLTTGTLAIS